jgi:hypothetical protein
MILPSEKACSLGSADFERFKALLILEATILAAYVGQHAMFSAGSTEATEPSGASERGYCGTLGPRDGGSKILSNPLH